MDRTQAIAIIGGGVAGLTLARTLCDLGFERLVVFERGEQVGGKSCTLSIDGRPHDLGATMGVPLDYRPIQTVSREVGIETERFPVEQHFDLERGRAVALNRWREMPGVIAAAARYVALHRRTWDPRGLHRADPALFAPWADIVARERLGAASTRMLCYRTGYGYGFDDEVPAVLYAHLIRPQTLRGLATGAPFMWRGGTQPIWTRLADRLANRVEIRTATEVTSIVREGGTVTVTGRGSGRSRVETFDQLVLACDPGLLGNVLDMTAFERSAYGQIRTYPYATFACEVEGLAEGRTSVGYIDANMCRERAGHPMAWVKRYADRDIYVFHLFAPDALPDAEIERRIAADVARLGGRFVATRVARRWRFFPHFDSAFMHAGGLATLDRMQGELRTFVTGEVLSFATMARVAEHAIAMGQRMARTRTRMSVTVRLAS